MGSFAPACGGRCFPSFFPFPLLPPPPPPPPFAPASCFSFVAMIYSSAGAPDRFPALDRNPFLRPILVDLPARPRGRAAFRIEQHHVRRVYRRRHLHDARLLVGRARPAMFLHDVHALDRHAASLGEDADDLAFLALVVATHDADGVALRHVKLLALGVVPVPLPVDGARPVGLAMFENSHVRSPRAPTTRSSCTASRAARARPVRRYASPGAPLAR